MPEIRRATLERRSCKDRLRIFSLHRFFYKGPERRKTLYDRRSQEERRDGWVRISKWSNMKIQSLKIARYINKKKRVQLFGQFSRCEYGV